MRTLLPIRILLACALVAMAAWARAEDLTTRSGKVFANVEVTELGPDFVRIQHKDGTDKIPLAELPAAWQKRLSAPVLFGELRRKTEELEKLKTELGRAQGETQVLRKETQALKQEKNQITAAASKAGVAIPPPKPVPAISTLPPLTPTTVVSAEEIAGQFRADPQGALQRYKGKTFRVQGTIERFNLKVFVRNYDVVLETGDHATKVVCNAPYEERYNAVYPKNGGQLLVGTTPSGGEVLLMRAGASATFKGRCAGMKDNQVAFSDCEPVK